MTGQPVGMLVEGPPDSPEGRRVDSRPASGGRAYSETDSTGGFTAQLSGPPVRGRPGEERVIAVLTEVIPALGVEVARIVGGRDDRGEDGLLSLAVAPSLFKSFRCQPSLECGGSSRLRTGLPGKAALTMLFVSFETRLCTRGIRHAGRF